MNTFRLKATKGVCVVEKNGEKKIYQKHKNGWRWICMEASQGNKRSDDLIKFAIGKSILFSAYINNR